MSYAWKDPIRLSTTWRFALTGAASGGPVVMTVISTLWALNWAMNPWWAYATIAVGILTVAAVVVLSVGRWRGCPEKPYIEIVFQELARKIWEQDPERLAGAVEEHRITLFELRRRPRCLRWLWDRRRFWSSGAWEEWTHELVPRLRDPRSGPRPSRKFRIHERKPKCCEGIAGTTFHRGHRTVVTEELPDVSKSDDVAEGTYRQWADLANDDWRKVRAEKYRTRIIGGVTIYASGERWGVLVLDSSDPTALSTRTLEQDFAKITLRVLSSMLERGRL